MRFCTLALDYDGTIATDGKLDRDVKRAIREARARGIVVMLVTGRILADLERVAGDLSFVDAVVAENGAVLSMGNGIVRLIGQPIPQIFVDELRSRGIQFSLGQCLVDTDASAAPEILTVIRQLELPLVLLFNRSRLMVLPQGVSKSVGLTEALALLRLSPHNTLGLGDAENDHDFLSVCEYGVAVGWGSKALQMNADDVLPGTGPAAVAPFIRQVTCEMRLPRGRLNRGRLVLGNDEQGLQVALSVRGRSLLISGDARTGKSWVAGLLCEQMILQGYSVCVIDAEGDYRSLETLPGVVVFGGDVPPPELPDVMRVLRHPQMSVVIDLSHVPYRDKVEYMNALLPMLAALRRSIGLPHRIVVDEAHYFLHEEDVKDLLDFELGAYTLITYRLADLHCDILKSIEGFIVKRTTDPREVSRLLSITAEDDSESAWRSLLGNLAVNEAALMPGMEESGGKLRRFELAPRLTTHVRHKAKYVDMELIQDQGFTFTENGQAIGLPARNLNDFVSALKTLPLSVLDGHARRGDFSQWINGVFHDHILASDVRKIEQRYRQGHARDLYNGLAATIQQRYDLRREVDDEKPEDAMSAAV